MKKYLLGIIAVGLAIGFSAFTKPTSGKNPTFYYYKMTSGSTLVEDDVKNKNNWTAATALDVCSGNQRACTIRVTQNNLNGVTFAADQASGSSHYRVASSSSGIDQIYNLTP